MLAVCGCRQLAERPSQLHLCPEERHPTVRPVSAPPRQAPFIAADMPHMAQFVYDMYMERLRTGEVPQRQQHEAHQQMTQQAQQQVPTAHRQRVVAKLGNF